MNFKLYLIGELTIISWNYPFCTDLKKAIVQIRKMQRCFFTPTLQILVNFVRSAYEIRDVLREGRASLDFTRSLHWVKASL